MIWIYNIICINIIVLEISFTLNLNVYFNWNIVCIWGTVGAEDPRCSLAGLEVPKSRAIKAYGEAHSLDKFKVQTWIVSLVSNYQYILLSSIVSKAFFFSTRFKFDFVNEFTIWKITMKNVIIYVVSFPLYPSLTLRICSIYSACGPVFPSGPVCPFLFITLQSS